MNFLESIWRVLCELSPWLLIGMLLSGILHVFLPANFARRKLHGFWGTVKSVAIGVPLPLCSCGVIPTGIGLRRDGASRGAAVAFLISTPQTGVDSVLVSASFLGLPFAIFKVCAAAIMGILGGWLTDGDRKKAGQPQSSNRALPVINSQSTISDPLSSNHPTSHAVAPWSWRKRILELLSHSIEMLRSIWVWMLLGVLISAIIDQLQLSSFFDQVSDAGLFPAMLLVLLFSIPLYVCATASVPIAASLVAGGLPPAVAMVFLMAGPATNVATIGAIRSQLGNRALVVYLSVIILGSMMSAWIFDGLVPTAGVLHDGHWHAHDHQSWLATISAGIVLMLTGWFIVEKLQRFVLLKRQPAAVSNTPTWHVGVSGMTCGNCVRKLERALNSIEGVQHVVVSLESDSATVAGEVTADAIMREVVGAGFQPLSAEKLNPSATPNLNPTQSTPPQQSVE